MSKGNHDERDSADFCLSGRSKPFSKKQDIAHDKKPKDIFSKFKPLKSSVDKEVAMNRERPKTAVKKAVTLKGQTGLWSRPSSANTRVKYKTKMRFPALKSSQSIDSAVSSQHSSTEDDKSSEEEEDNNEDSPGPLTSEEDDVDCSEDSGIIKVRVVSRSSSSEDKTTDDSPRTSPPARSILVKEFNRSPDITEDIAEPVEEIVDCAPSPPEEQSEDEESKIEPPPAASLGKRAEDSAEQDLTVQTDIKLLEVGSDDESELITKLRSEKTEQRSNIESIDEIKIDDIEGNETQSELKDVEINHVQSVSKSRPPDVSSDNYNPELYQSSTKECQEMSQNSSLLQLVQSGADSKSYEQMIESTIIRLEKEENTNAQTEPKIEISLITKPSNDNEEPEKARLSEAELENLKQKCISRMRTQQATPIVTNPPVLKEFSNSQKLLNFLDEAEEKDKTILNSVKRSSYNMQAGQAKSNLPSLSELLTKSVAELSEEVMTLKLELETERRSCAVLRTGLDQHQRTAQEKSKQLVKESKQRLDAQRQEYEAAIARHQTFIDQLIDDKKNISQKCEHLTTELRNTERRNKENTKAMESRHNMEMNRIKQINESADRLKRERWMDQKAKKIKEQTVKSLESEVQKIMSRHATELSEIKARHKQELEEQELGLREHFQKYFDQVKLEAERDKKELLEQEKIFQLERFRKQSEQMESFHQAEVGRLKEELDRERDRREEERQKMVAEAEHVRKIARERGSLEVERVKEEMEEMRKSLVRRHANELTTFRANEESERKEFERRVREKMDKDWYEKESHLRAQFTRERDQEIDRVIEKLEFEMKKVREDGEKSTEARVSRLKTKHENEIGELIKEIEDHKYKNNEMKEKLANREGEALLLTSVNKQMDIQIRELETIKTKLIEERNDVAGVVRKEFAENLDMLTDENTKLKTDLNHQVVTHKSALLEKDLNLRAAQNDFEKNINQLHEKVQMTVEKKEKVIEELRAQYEMAVEKISQLESIITQQSVDIVSKNKRTNSSIERALKNQTVDVKKK